MKKVMAIILSMVMFISMLGIFSISASADTTEFAGGSGTEEDPYLVSTADHLDNVRYYLDSHFKMINNIDLSDFSAWREIGSFSGVFDGDRYTVNGLSASLFGVNSGTIKNVSVVGTIVSYASSNAPGRIGGIASANGTNGKIINCSSAIDITVSHVNATGEVRVGGIVGVNEGSIVACYNNGNISCSIYVDSPWAGGIAGESSGVIENCYNTGAISATNTKSSTFSYYAYAGGITASANSDATVKLIRNCYNMGTVSASAVWGGGKAYAIAPKLISNCYYLDGTGTSTSGCVSRTTKDMTKKVSFSGFDFDTVWTMGGDPEYEYPELQCFALSGKLGIKGDCAYLSTVQIDLSQINRVDETFTYEWFVDGVSVGTDTQYAIQSSDIGKKIQCKVVGTKENNEGTLYSDEIVVSKAIQTLEAQDAQQLVVDDHSFVFTTVDTQEYSLDGESWQAEGVFENLDPNKTYTVYSRVAENDLYLPGESKAVLTVTTERRPLTGSVSISGTGRYGDTLTANVVNVGPGGATYTYEWKRGESVLGTQSSYKVCAEDIGATITLTVHGSEDYIGSLTSPAMIGQKALGGSALAPITAEVTNTSVTLAARSGYEYSLNGAAWQDSPTFSGLSPAQEYTFYQRIKESAINLAGPTSAATSVSTLKNEGATAAAPQASAVGSNSITLIAVAGCEYSKDGTTWQDSPIFENLRPCSEYTFYQRVKENATDYAGAASAPALISTLRTHEFDNACDAACNVCGDIREVPDHIYDNACDTACNICQAERTVPDHVYDNACDTACNICGFTRAVPDHIYDNACDTACNVCGAEREVPPHNTTIEHYTFQNDSRYPFSLSGGIYSSTNKSNSTTSTAVLTALQSGSISIEYYTSTERNYDKLTIKKNSSTLVTASGSTSWTPITIGVNAGDKIYLSYGKDGSEYDGSDVVRFELSSATTSLQPTCTEAVYCLECNAKVADALGHTYSNACDKSCNRSGCTNTRTVPAHEYDHSCDRSCNVCGATRSITHKYAAATCAAPKTCTVCGTTSGSKLSHSYKAATCTEPKTCKACGATSGSALGHSYKDATCTAPETCTRCSATSGSALGHNYKDATCTKAKTCITCGATSGSALGHSYQAATCTKAKTCTICGSTSGSSLGHSYKAATCTKAKTCTRCSATSGSKAGHTYKKVITKASLTRDGKINNQCKVCGYLSSQSTVVKQIKGVTLSSTAYTYNGSARTPGVTVKDIAGKTLKKGTDYVVTYSSGRIKAGTYKVKVTFKGNYNGSRTLTFKINKASASKASVKASQTLFAYNGKTRTPTVTVKGIGGVTLKKGTDYVLTYSSGRKNVGTYKVKVTFKGNYTGSKTISYTIAPTTQSEASILIGGYGRINAKSNKTIKFSSSNTKIASINSKGVITAKKAGKVTITVKSGTVSRKIALKVAKPTLQISGNSSLYIGDTAKMQAVTNVSGAKIQWSVNNTKVAKISSSGRLTGKKRGTVTVTAKMTYGGKTYKDTFKVKVTAEFPDLEIFMTEETKYSDTYGFTLTNNSKHTIKVLNQGTVYVGNDSESIDSLFIRSGYYKSINVSPGSYTTMLACLDDDLLFLSYNTVYMDIYLEYRGETFRASCRSSIGGVDQCYKLTWLYD